MTVPATRWPFTSWAWGSETSKVTRDGVTLLGIDVNASAGRHVDVRVTADPQQVLRLDIAPSFQLDLEYKMASVNPLVQKPRNLRS